MNTIKKITHKRLFQDILSSLIYNTIIQEYKAPKKIVKPKLTIKKIEKSKVIL